MTAKPVPFELSVYHHETYDRCWEVDVILADDTLMHWDINDGYQSQREAEEAGRAAVERLGKTRKGRRHKVSGVDLVPLLVGGER